MVPLKHRVVFGLVIDWDELCGTLAKLDKFFLCPVQNRVKLWRYLMPELLLVAANVFAARCT